MVGVDKKLWNPEAIARQTAEFDRLTELAEAWRKLCQVPIVDDDYPEYRSRYEGAMHRFLAAAKTNRPEVFAGAVDQGPLRETIANLERVVETAERAVKHAREHLKE